MVKAFFEINNLTGFRVDKKFLKKVAEKTLSLTKFKIPELSIVLICDARMKRLNRKYKGKNKVTDVLAFDYSLPTSGQARPDSARQGEIIICFSQAKRQARKLKHSIKKELGILLIHGILHLIGYNDQTKKQRERMIKRQDNIFLKIKNSPS